MANLAGLLRTPMFDAPFDKTVTRPWALFFGDLSGAVDILSGTHAERIALRDPVNPSAGFLASAFPLNSLFIETDRNSIYQARIVGSAAAWVFVSGRARGVQADLPADLGTNDKGFIYEVTDYAHVLGWSGAAWAWGRGETGSGYVTPFLVDPTGSGWHLCDGTVGVSYLKADGTLGTITLPNLTATAAYLKFAAAVTGITAAVPPGLTGSTASGTAVIAGNTAVDTGAGQIVQSGTGVTVAAHTHVHASTGLTDSGHTHAKGTLAVDATAEPSVISMKPWFRQ